MIKSIYSFIQICFFLIICILGTFSSQYALIGQEYNPDINYYKNTYTYKIVDKHEIKADVYKGPEEGIQPVIMWIHGGALILGTRDWINIEFLNVWIEKGYTVVSIDYRLAPETKLASIIEDVEDAYYWVRNKGPGLFNIDPDRIGVSGGSAGGYLTLMTGFRVNPPPRALISFYGYGDITGSWYSQPDSFYNQETKVSTEKAYNVIGDSIISNTPQFLIDGRSQFYLYCRQQGLWPQKVSGHDPDSEKLWFSGYEPLRNISKNYPPTLLLHGEKDTDVPFEQSFLMSEELKQQGVEFEFINNPDWGHGFDFAGLKDPAVKDAFNKVLKFLEKHL
jgi:acetyl esterase/lipase